MWRMSALATVSVGTAGALVSMVMIKSAAVALNDTLSLPAASTALARMRYLPSANAVVALVLNVKLPLVAKALPSKL